MTVLQAQRKSLALSQVTVGAGEQYREQPVGGHPDDELGPSRPEIITGPPGVSHRISGSLLSSLMEQSTLTLDMTTTT